MKKILSALFALSLLSAAPAWALFPDAGEVCNLTQNYCSTNAHATIEVNAEDGDVLAVRAGSTAFEAGTLTTIRVLADNITIFFYGNPEFHGIQNNNAFGIVGDNFRGIGCFTVSGAGSVDGPNGLYVSGDKAMIDCVEVGDVSDEGIQLSDAGLSMWIGRATFPGTSAVGVDIQIQQGSQIQSHMHIGQGNPCTTDLNGNDLVIEQTIEGDCQ